MPDSRQVADYYDRTQRWYTRFYSDRVSLALHFGLWEQGMPRAQALLNQYRIVAELLQPRAGQLILDAGCGVGGACFWLAENTLATYLGLTVSNVQYDLANHYCQERKLADRVSFQRGDFAHTPFADETFDHVFGIESFCHSYPHPDRAFREMFRLTKPGGRLIMNDGFLRRQPINELEERLASEVVRGFKLFGWSTRDEIISALEQVGWRNVKTIDRNKQVYPSVLDVDRRYRLVAPLLWIGEKLRLVSQTESEQKYFGRSQRKLFEAGISGYATFIAEKPTSPRP